MEEEQIQSTPYHARKNMCQIIFVHVMNMTSNPNSPHLNILMA